MIYFKISHTSTDCRLEKNKMTYKTTTYTRLYLLVGATLKPQII